MCGCYIFNRSLEGNNDTISPSLGHHLSWKISEQATFTFNLGKLLIKRARFNFVKLRYCHMHLFDKSVWYNFTQHQFVQLSISTGYAGVHNNCPALPGGAYFHCRSPVINSKCSKLQMGNSMRYVRYCRRRERMMPLIILRRRRKRGILVLFLI